MLEEYGLNIVRLDLPFRLNHVNCFIAEGENGWIVIDAGLHNQKTVKRWEQELSNKKVTDILITHYHPDHFGYAGGLQKRHDAKVSMSKVDADAGLGAWGKDSINLLRDNYLLTGVTQELAREMTKNTDDFTSLVTPYPVVNHYFKEGEKIKIGKYEYEVIFTPGHSDGLITFFNKDKSVLISTDHILPRITPNISYWFHGNPDPLASYLDSLEKIKKLDVDLVIPSHGDPFYGGSDRIAEIKSHHDERLSKTLESINQGGTVADVSEEMFQMKLTVHEARFAIGETLAHLEYLRRKEECQREMRDGKWWYFI